MPIYVFECQKCHTVQEFMLGLSEVSSLVVGDLADLEPLGCSCESCKNTQFKKLPTAHGKTAVNWASWNTERKA